MTYNRNRKLAIAKISIATLLAYFLLSYSYLYIVTVSSRSDQQLADDDQALLKNNEDSTNKRRDVVIDVEDKEIDRAILSAANDSIKNQVTFRYRINNEHLCHEGGSSSRTFLLVYVHSDPANYMKRLLLRQTWAQPKLYELPIRIVFFVGVRSKEPTIEQAVQLESANFHDIVQTGYEDTYRNLSYKSLFAIHWITTYCNHSRFVLKTDDDAYVNMRALLHHLNDLDTPRTCSRPPRHMVLCRIWHGMQPLRHDIKWGVTKEEFQGDVYPSYCSGVAWVVTQDMIRALYGVFDRVAHFWIDDVYITGMLTERLEKAGLTINWAQFNHVYIKMDKMEAFDSPVWYRYLFVHLAETHYFATMWSKMEAAASKYPIPDVSIVVPGFIAGHKITLKVE